MIFVDGDWPQIETAERLARGHGVTGNGRVHPREKLGQNVGLEQLPIRRAKTAKVSAGDA